MWAWLATIGMNNGHMSSQTIQSLPRELSLGEDGTLQIKPLRELESLRTDLAERALARIAERLGGAAARRSERDADRRRILEQELANEQKLLEEARKQLAAQESVRLGSERNYQRVLDRLEPYQKQVKLHEDNIANLQKELANLR